MAALPHTVSIHENRQEEVSDDRKMATAVERALGGFIKCGAIAKTNVWRPRGNGSSHCSRAASWRTGIEPFYLCSQHAKIEAGRFSMRGWRLTHMATGQEATGYTSYAVRREISRIVKESSAKADRTTTG